ncbi:544_t:CDS:2 [Acaulospora morrowiae]|uniref:544_t:CDS:1 n=1 Tax=Acaulospora morrowiae TaxID=94023 RepID=A0A9N9C116_9GLOM|nr:544_t:CDS:2 [Acaulospora morrowiae]
MSRITTLTLSYLSALLISSVCGTQYLFSAYSTEIQDRLDFTSVQINTIGSLANYGITLSKPFLGYVADNYGSRRTCAAAAILIFTSYFLLAMTYQKIFLPASFMLCALYLFGVGMASSAGIVSSMVTITKNITSLRGFALSVPLALLGLSAFIYSQINMHLFQDDTFHFLIFVAVSSGTCLFIGSWFLVIVPPPLLTTASLFEGENYINKSINEEDKNCNDNISNSSGHDYSIAHGGSNGRSTEQTPLLQIQEITKEEPDIGGWELLNNKDALLLILIMVFIGGTGLMYFNNVGTIIRTLYYASSTHPTFPSEIRRLQNIHVSLLSLFSCLGRISGGLFSDLAKYFYDVPRFGFLALAGIWLFAGQILMCTQVQTLENLWTVTCFVGFGFGMQYGVAPAITSEYFGSRRFGLNWGILSLFPAIGGQIFNLMFGYNNDLHGKHCVGAECYNSVFYISSVGCLVSVCVALHICWNILRMK